MSHLGLTVYGPEVAKSGLTDDLDFFIQGKTSLTIKERFFAIHSRASIEEFYSITGSTVGKHWPIVLDLFDARPACVTIWEGPRALPLLIATKGKTQPAEAALGTVRSRFWCDNPVANLIHVSDDDAVMAEELKILSRASVGSEEAGWRNLDTGGLAHSSFETLLTLLGRPASTRCSAKHARDDAREHARKAIEEAKVLAVVEGLHPVVKAYLEGDPAGLRGLLCQHTNVSAWDRLMLEAGLFGMPYWNSVLRSAMPANAGEMQ